MISFLKLIFSLDHGSVSKSKSLIIVHQSSQTNLLTAPNGLLAKSWASMGRSGPNPLITEWKFHCDKIIWCIIRDRSPWFGRWVSSAHGWRFQREDLIEKAADVWCSSHDKDTVQGYGWPTSWLYCSSSIGFFTSQLSQSRFSPISTSCDFQSQRKLILVKTAIVIFSCSLWYSL